MALRPASVHFRTLSRAPFLVRGCFCVLGCLWNRSVTRRCHARGLRVLTWSSTDHSIVIGDSPTWSLSFHKRKVGLRTRLVTRRQSHKFNLEPHSGLVQAQPAGIYSISLQVHVGAVHPSQPPYTLHHQDPDLDRPVTHFWLTSRHLLVYSPDARTLFHPHVLSLPMTTVWELCRPS